MGSNNQEELQSGSPLANVYVVPGEPAIIIDGVPRVDQSEHFQSHIVTEADSERHRGCREWMEGRVVQKMFRKQMYSGTVTMFDRATGWYRVVYVDGDFEDLEWHELEDILVPLDITVSLTTVVLKRLKNIEMQDHKKIDQLPSRKYRKKTKTHLK